MMAAPVRLSIVAAAAALGAIGLTLALVGIGLPFLLAAIASAGLAGLAHHFAARATPQTSASQDALAKLTLEMEQYRTHAGALRHDLRGVLSPALMMSDRLLNHPDPAVQRAGNAVVKSIDRATALLAESKTLLTAEGTPPP